MKRRNRYKHRVSSPEGTKERHDERIATFHESTVIEVQAGLQRHKPGSRNRKKVGR